jgi:uncharacterized protein Yka (UPF0111/DUF47 family)
MKYTTALTLLHDNWLQKIVIGIRLAFSQDKILSAISDIQHVNSLLQTRNDIESEFKKTGIELADLTQETVEIADRSIKTLEGLFDGRTH